MRRFATVAAGLLAVLALGSSVTQTGATPRPPATQRVTVGATCTDAGADSTWVDPWAVRIHQGDDVLWVLAEGTQVRTMQILPKRGQAWPFAGDPPRGGPQNPARSGASHRIGRYQYDIMLMCVRPSGGTVRVVIDPEIIIGEQ